MAGTGKTFWGRRLQRWRLAYWRQAADRAAALPHDDLRQLRGDARQLRREIDRVLQTASLRLMQPLVGPDTLHPGKVADWTWRPSLWCRPVAPVGMVTAKSGAALDDETAVHHDGAGTEIALRQVRNTGAGDLAPFALVLDVLAFAGSFLSLSITLPPEARQGLRLAHLIRVEVTVDCDRQTAIKARLNVKHGPNTAQTIAEMAEVSGLRSAEFDLRHSKVNEKRVEAIWVDLFFDPPAMNRIVLRDATFSRRPLAEL